MLLLVASAGPSQSSIFSNKVEASPPKVQKIELYFIDLSKSVDQSTLQSGIANLKQKTTKSYPVTIDGIKVSAESYIWWYPILGTRDPAKFFRPLFSGSHDLGVWNAVRGNIKGKTNQTLTLNKLRSPNGGWAQVLNDKTFSTSRCLSTLTKRLASAGVAGGSLKQLAIEVCRQAQLVQNSFEVLQEAVSLYGSGKEVTNGGTDIFGSIARLKQEINSNKFKGYSDIEITFVSDMVHNTSRRLKAELLQSPSRACNLGKSDAGLSGLKLSQAYSIRIFGMGERQTQNRGGVTEALRIPLENYWSCYWKKVGVNPKFGQLENLGMD